MKISEKIINIRNEFNLTQEDLAEKLNVSRQTVSNWENSKCYPDIETLIIISEKFNLSLDDLLKEDRDMVKTIDKQVKGNRKKIKVIITLLIVTILLIIAFYFGYKSFLLNYYDNGYSQKLYENYFENLEQITIEHNASLANHSFYDLNIYIPLGYSNKHIHSGDFYLGSETVLSLYKFTTPFYEFASQGEFYKNIDYEKLFKQNDIKHPVDLIRYFEILYDRKPNIFWDKNDIELLYLMKNYVILENEYGANNFKRYYWCNYLNGIMTITDKKYNIEIYHENEVYLISIDKDIFKFEQVQEILSSIYFG